jgi:hypothetical protein
MNYIQNFEKSRKTLIGSSDVPALIQHPEKPESIAGFDRTALTVYLEKTGQKERDPAGLHAKLGHILEPHVLYEAISILSDDKTAKDFLRGYTLCELDSTKAGYPTAPDYQNTDWLHHTEAVNDFSVSHADCINVKDGIIIEAKTASYWASHRREADPYKGYDPKLKGAQGVPLAHYMQIQHQMYMYSSVYGVHIKKGYIALISDGVFNMWEIKPDIKVQERIAELCSKMKICIDAKTPPKDLAMNTDDIKAMYPEIKEDFKIISGDDSQKAIEYALTQKEAAKQESAWKQKKEDAAAALAVILKDTGTIKAMIDGALVDVASWQPRAGAERVMSLSEIKKNKENVYKYLVKNECINKSEDTRSVKVKYKGD